MKFGLSVTYFLPWVMLPGGLDLADLCAREGGMWFWQMLPLRGINPRYLPNDFLPIGYVEPGWPREFCDLLPGKRRPGERWLNCLLDTLMFPGPSKCQKRVKAFLETPGRNKTQLISHDPEDGRQGALVEVRQQPHLALWQWEEFAKDIGRKCLVLDTKHSREAFPNWDALVLVLLRWAALLHLQPLNKDELLGVLEGKETELGQMFQLIKQGMNLYGDVPCVIEVDPRWLGPSCFLYPLRMIEILKLFRGYLERV